jgi:hypothetical protein
MVAGERPSARRLRFPPPARSKTGPGIAAGAGRRLAARQAARRIAGSQRVPLSRFSASFASSSFFSRAKFSAASFVLPSATASSACCFDTRAKYSAAVGCHQSAMSSFSAATSSSAVAEVTPSRERAEIAGARLDGGFGVGPTAPLLPLLPHSRRSPDGFPTGQKGGDETFADRARRLSSI